MSSYLFFSNITAAGTNCSGPEDDFYCLSDFTHKLVGKAWLWQDQYFNNVHIKIIGGGSSRIWFNGVHLGDFPARLINGSIDSRWPDTLEADLWIMVNGHNYRVYLRGNDERVDVTVDGLTYTY